MYDEFTEEVQQVMEEAQREAKLRHHEYIGTEHILLALIKSHGMAVKVLKNLDIDLNEVSTEVEKKLVPSAYSETGRFLPLTPRAKKALEYTTEEFWQFGHQDDGTEHLLLGLMRESEGVAAVVLRDLGLTLRDAQNEVLTLLEQDVREIRKRG